jgi:stage V sporulation protein B
VSIIPAIAAALANHRAKEARDIMESSLKLTNLLAMPAALGLCVLAYPIFNVLYWGSNENGPRLLVIFGIASYFICMQLLTTAILQANGHERVPVLTYPIGGILQIALDWFLVGNPDIGIIGSPIGTLSCYFTITVLNLIFIIIKVGKLPNFGKVFVMPALCSGVMAVAAWSIYELLYKAGSGALGVSRLSLGVFMVGAILVALVVYLVLIIVTKTITREDMKLLPKGEKLANILKIR